MVSCNRLPLICVICVILLITCLYPYVRYMEPRYIRSRGKKGVISPYAAHWSLYLIFAAFVIMLLISLYRTVVTHAGHVPAICIPDEDEEEKEEKRDTKIPSKVTRHLLIPCYDSKHNACRRWCRKCRWYKPDRTHHCYDCGQCVLKMDHHCVFVNNCVGFANQNFFYCFLFWGMLASSFVAIDLWRIDFIALLQVSPSFTYTVYVSICFVMSVVFGLVLGGFLGFHLYMTSHGYTTIEYMEKRHAKKFGNKYHHPYSTTLYRNLCIVFGPHPWRWFLPLTISHPHASPPDICDGIIYPSSVSHPQPHLVETWYEYRKQHPLLEPGQPRPIMRRAPSMQPAQQQQTKMQKKGKQS